MKFVYELVAVGAIPTWDKAMNEAFCNPVHVGDKVKTMEFGSELLTVKAVEHYSSGSVLYVVPDNK